MARPPSPKGAIQMLLLRKNRRAISQFFNWTFALRITLVICLFVGAAAPCPDSDIRCAFASQERAYGAN